MNYIHIQICTCAERVLEKEMEIVHDSYIVEYFRNFFGEFFTVSDLKTGACHKREKKKNL